MFFFTLELVTKIPGLLAHRAGRAVIFTRLDSGDKSHAGWRL